MKKSSVYVVEFIVGLIANIAMVAFPVYYLALGLSPFKIGILTSIGFLGVLFLPYIGSITDRIQKPKLMLQFIFMTMAIVGFLMLLLVLPLLLLLISFQFLGTT